MISAILELNSKFLENAKKRLELESALYLSPQKKLVLSNLPLVENEKNVNLTLFNFKNLKFLTVFAFGSITFDLLKNRNKFQYSRGNILTTTLKTTAFRILLLNCFYYLFLTDYDKFYSIIYHKQKNNKI